MGFTKGHFSKWSGIVLNIIIYVFITIFMYLILNKLLKDEENSSEKSTVLAFISSITLASLSNVVYIRMYALSTLNILITTYLHIKLLEKEKLNFKLLLGIGISALAGVLTHYYYIFYLVMLYLIFFMKYIKEKQVKKLVYYTITMVISAIVSLVIFPYSIQHMFFGYRGQGVISNLENITDTVIKSILPNINTLNYYGFNNLMYVILVAIVGMFIFNKVRKNKVKLNKDVLRLMAIPTAFFFIMTAISSPWNVLRYIVPVFALIFVIVIYYLYVLLQSAFREKVSNIVITLLFLVILITPMVLKMEPELLYRDRKEIVEKLSGELNLPTIYLFNTGRGKFIDDILLFSKINESYIAKEIEYTKQNIQEIFKEKDVSNGIIVFINEEETESLLNMVREAMHLDNIELLKELNSCKVYCVK